MTSLIGRNYARALFELVRDGPGDSGVEPDLHTARQALFDDRDVREFLANRLISRTTKKKVVRDAFEGRVDGRLLVLLFLLVDRGRADLLGEITEEYERLSRLARGVRKVTVDSAFALDAEETERVTRALEARLHARVELEPRRRPSLIGGVVATSEGREIEFSIEGRLRDFEDRLRREGSPRVPRKPDGTQE